jgi:hypothetical protein
MVIYYVSVFLEESEIASVIQVGVAKKDSRDVKRRVA